MGADSRGTIHDYDGSRVELNIQQKLIRVSGRAGILTFGASNQACYMIEKFRRNSKNMKEGVTDVAEALSAFCIRESRKLSDVAGKIPHFGFIIAGVDVAKSGTAPKCYSLKSTSGFWPGLYGQGFGIEGKPIIAYYLFAKKFTAGMGLDDLVRLVVGALHDTASVDGDVGGDLSVAIIDDSGMREIPQTDIADKIDRWRSE